MTMRLKGLVLAPAPTPEASSGAPATLPAQSRVANRPIICHVIDALRDAGADEVAVIGNASSLERLRASEQPPLGGVTYIDARSDENLVGLISAAAPFVGDDPCVVHLADGLAGAPITPLPGLCSGAPDVGVFVHHGRGRGLELDGELAQLLGIAPPDRARSGLGIAGVGYLGPRALAHACSPDAASRRPAPGLTALAERISAGGGRLHVGRLASWRRYGGDPEDLLEINRMVLDRLPADAEGAEYVGPGSHIEGRVQIHPSARILDCVISGPVVIGPEAHIEGSYVGPHTSISAGVRLVGCEIESSIVSEAASIENIGARIVASTIGPNARIRRRFALPRGLRLRVGADAELAID